MMQLLEVPANHRRACELFSAIVAQGEGRWANPSPCPEWDARGVVEHVVDTYDNMLLRPTGVETVRPTDDPIANWAATVDALIGATDPTALADRDLDGLLSALTGEVLIHSWDLAKALGVDAYLDAELCAATYENMRAHEDQVRASGLFSQGVLVPTDADAVTQLIAFAGRDPEWTARPS